MNRAILRSVPRLVTAATGRARPAFCANRPAFTRLLSTNSTPPPIPPEPVTSTPPATQDAEAQPLAEPEILSAPPPPPIADATASIADTAGAAAATTDVVTAEAASSFSDTLLQPALALLNTVHDVTGLPWWLAIGTATLAIRTLLLPVTLMTMRNSARMGALKDEIAERREAVMVAVRAGDRPAAADRQKDMQQFMRNAGVTPLKVLAGPLVQFPIFISFFVGLRRLSQADPTFATGGVAWFVDLAVRDPIFVLPVLCGFSLVTMTELGGDSGSTQLSPQMKMGMRAIAVLSVPMTYWFPSAVFCYWIPNNLFSIGLGAALRTKPTRKLLGLDIDLEKIPGTKAAKLLEAKKVAAKRGVGITIPVDAAEAVASYSRRASSTPSAKVVKPVLLKHRPAKKMKSPVN